MRKFNRDDLEPAARREFDRLFAALKQIVTDWDSVPEDKQVPDEINDTEHWDEARAAIAETEGKATT